MNNPNQYNFYPGMYMPQIPQMQINNIKFELLNKKIIKFLIK